MRDKLQGTLILQLKGPMQSWGGESKFNHRRTEHYPTKSGVVGLIASALGIKRTEDSKIQQLARMRVGVFAVKQGQLLRDYHVAHEEIYWTNQDPKHTHITHRYYLADAHFVAGIEGPLSELAKIKNALGAPCYPLYLGRRSCPPSEDIFMSVAEKELINALTEQTARHFPQGGKVPILVDSADAKGGVRYARDLPLSFNTLRRMYSFRPVEEVVAQVPPTSEMLTDVFESAKQNLATTNPS